MQIFLVGGVVGRPVDHARELAAPALPLCRVREVRVPEEQARQSLETLLGNDTAKENTMTLEIEEAIGGSKLLLGVPAWNRL